MTTPTDPTAALKLARDALTWLHNMAEGGKAVDHLYDGDCPDQLDRTRRDPACPACQALDKAAAAIAAIDALPAPSGEPTAEQKRAGARAWMEAIADPDMSPTDKVAHVYRAMLGARTPQAAPAPHVGDSDFEAWHSTYNPACKGDKQRARDAYAAGMSDPAAQAAPALQAELVAEFESWVRADSTLPLTRDAHGYADFNVALMWHAWQAAKKANAPGGALEGGSDANARPGLAGADSACAHEFALQPSSSILLCCRCGASETAVRSAQRRATPQAAPAPQAAPTDEEIGHVTIEQARVALDSLDDFARMRTSVDAMGPRRTLEVFIAQVEAAPAVAAPVQPRLAALVLELAEAVDNAAADIGGSRPQLDILREAVAIAHGITATPVKG